MVTEADAKMVKGLSQHMYVIVHLQLSCHQCGVSRGWPDRAVELAGHGALYAGWTIVDKRRVLCPQCSQAEGAGS